MHEKLAQKFEEELALLNEQQRRAVEQVEGPVMVIAGPGTGKTQILSARIGKILLSDAQVAPENILCLTYTDAGAVAMRRRLQQFIGPDAYRVHIYTFHAFCNEIIQSNLGLFEKTNLDPVSELERIELLKELIDGFEKDHPLKRYRGDVYFEIHGLQSLFALMKREGWTGDFICSKVDEYLKSLPERDDFICKRATKEFKKGDVRWDKIEAEKERFEKLRAACNEAKKFNELMHRRGRYDFDDMINWVIEAFETNDTLLRSCQEQFQYILVDEYQDTSGSQNKIIELLISYWEKPNIFVVGDDDQSIFRFQGANVENMLAFAEGYSKDLLTIVLTANYRSTQPILDVSKTLIGRNSERLVNKLEGLTKDLKALGTHAAGEHATVLPVVKEYASAGEELMGLVTDVESLVDKGVHPSEIGVIYKENKYGEELSKYLQLKNIPYYSRRRLNILDQPLIRQLLTVLEYLAAEHDHPYSGDELLFEILHYEWFSIPPLEIAKATVEVAELKYKDKTLSLRRWVCEAAAQRPRDLFTPGLCRELCSVVQSLESLIGAAPNHTLQGLIEKVVREAGFLGYVMNHSEKHWFLQLITGFYQHVQSETARTPLLNLYDFLGRIDLMRKEGLVLPLIQVSGSEKGVNLVTAHGSKGLEWEHVFVANCTAGSWEKKRKPYSGFTLPDTIFSTTSSENNDAQELRRLFYVAMTRARKTLQLSFAHASAEGRTQEPSMFLAELNTEMNLPRQVVKMDAETVSAFAALQLGGMIAPQIAPLADELTDRIVAAFQMSASTLNSYLRCPLDFYFRSIVRIPSPRNEAAEFGSAVHHALEQLFKKASEHGAFTPVENFVQDFEWYINRNKQHFTREQFKRRVEYGQQILKAWYDKYIPGANKVVAIERNFRSVEMDGLMLKGKVDKIEFTGKDAVIVDYKTGDPEKNREKFARPNPKIPHGGDYWRQAVFYKLLLDNYKGKDWRVQNVIFDFIEPNKKKEYVREQVLIGPEDETAVKAQIKTVTEKIKAKDFYTGCGKEECHWCRFVKTNKMAVALHEIHPEEEEPAKKPLMWAVE